MFSVSLRAGDFTVNRLAPNNDYSHCTAQCSENQSTTKVITQNVLNMACSCTALSWYTVLWYIAHETALCHNQLISNFTENRKKLDRSLIDQHLSMLSFYENMTINFFVYTTFSQKVCLQPKCLVTWRSQSDESWGLRQIVSWAICSCLHSSAKANWFIRMFPPHPLQSTNLILAPKG
jgi:hypothetical protein